MSDILQQANIAPRSRPRRVMMIGLRGIPDVPGGIERHVQHLSTALAARGFEIEVISRPQYVDARAVDIGPGVKMTAVWSPRSKNLETLAHSVLAVLYAAWRRPDILHVHAIGPAIVTPLARLLGLTVVVTHHGHDYERERWGWMARNILKLGEVLGMKFANQCITVSSAISHSVKRRLGRNCTPIVNGVNLPVIERIGADYIESLGLKPRAYILNVGRVVPEKRQIDLIKAFRKANLTDVKLVIAGGIEYESDYLKEVKDVVSSGSDVIMTGYITGEPLKQIYKHAKCFVLPSSHEGLPIALLEALSYGLPVLASAIDANLEVGLGDGAYFPPGAVDELAAKLARLPVEDKASFAHRRDMVRQGFSWENVADRTVEVYEAALA